MKLFVVLSNEVQPFGKVLNAIGHMIVGLAPRIPVGKFPDIELFSSTSQGVRDFRKLAYPYHQSPDFAFSDFSHTTTEGSAKDHELNTFKINESDIQYYASCICGSSDQLAPLSQFLSASEYHKLSSLSNSDLSDFELERSIEYPEAPDFVEDTKKFSIVLSSKLSTTDSILSVIKACTVLGNSSDRSALRLHEYPDADRTLHPGMSEYGLVALKAKNSARMGALNTFCKERKKEFDSVSYVKLGEQEAAIGMFGDRQLLQEATNKNISLWSGKLIEQAHVGPSDLPSGSKAYVVNYNKSADKNSDPVAKGDVEEISEGIKHKLNV